MRAPLKRQQQPCNSSTPASCQAEPGVLPEHMLSTPAWSTGQDTPPVWLLQALSWNSDLSSDGKLLQPFLMDPSCLNTLLCVMALLPVTIFLFDSKDSTQKWFPISSIYLPPDKALFCPALSSAWRQHHVWVGIEVPPWSEQLNISPLLGTQQLNPLLLQQPCLLSHFTLHHGYSVFALASSSMDYSLSITFQKLNHTDMKINTSSHKVFISLLATVIS